VSIYAKVIADSISPRGDRLTTMEVQCHRFVLAEFNTHRAFSRNSASSRAIPFKKQLERMEELGLAYPLRWPREQKGMQGGDEFDNEDIVQFRRLWEMSARSMVDAARAAHGAGLHKSVVNRLLEPFMWHKIIVSATEWENFFSQRVSPLAQPEIRVVAEKMMTALYKSEPDELDYGDWHTPYIQPGENLEVDHQNDLLRISAARCARVSYLTHEGKRDLNADIDLYEKLVTASPPHWSPLEHVATPTSGLGDNNGTGNFSGWRQLRHYLLPGNAA
jgi:thymidylate synthase ThyX